MNFNTPFIFLFFLLPFPLLAQYGITQQVSNTDKDLHSIYFLKNGNTGWIVGDSGTVLHTTNAGSDWNAQQSGTGQDLRCVRFPDADTGWAVGDSGTVLYTEDGGSAWSAQNSGTEADLYSGHFISSDTGWAVGDSGTVLRTFDGGMNWTAQNSGTLKKLRSVDFYGAQVGCAVGDSGVIIRTTDAGSNWGVIDTAPDTLYSLDLVDSSFAWASGANATIMESQDSGSNWSENSPSFNTGTIRSIRSTDTAKAWITVNFDTTGRTFYSNNAFSGEWENILGYNYYSPPSLLSHHPLSLDSGWVIGTSGEIHLISDTAVGIKPYEDPQEDEITLRPNPFQNSVRFHFKGEERPNSITLYSLQGKKVREERLNKSKSHTLRRKGLKAGTYIYEARNEEGVIGRGKLVVE